MTRSIPILLAAVVLVAGACGPKPDTEEPPRRSTDSNPATGPEARPADRPVDTRPGTGPHAQPKGNVVITAAEAKAKGLPPIAISLSTTGTAWSVTKLPGKDVYLRLSGPPGGPLSLALHTWPRPKASGSTLTNWVTGTFNKPHHQPVKLGTPTRFTLAGLARPALSFTSGKSMSRTAYCAVLMASAAKPPVEFLVLFGHGASKGQPPCDAIAKHNQLAPVLQSLQLLP